MGVIAGVGVPSGVALVARKALLAMDRVLVETTPIDTGRARANWIASVREPVDAEVPISNDPLAQAKEVIDNWDPEDGEIFITNNVPYIEALENGSSAQAPSGMVTAAIAVGESIVRRSNFRIT